MLARTDQQSKRPPQPFNPKRVLQRILWWVRGLVWIGAHLGFLGWHGLEALYKRGAPGMETPTWGMCVQRSLEQSWPDAACRDMVAEAVGKYAPCALLGFFWIYRDLELEHNPDGKLVGGREYLNLEIAVTIIRALAWFLLAPGGIVEIAPEAALRIHIVLFFLSLVVRPPSPAISFSHSHIYRPLSSSSPV